MAFRLTPTLTAVTEAASSCGVGGGSSTGDSVAAASWVSSMAPPEELDAASADMSGLSGVTAAIFCSRTHGRINTKPLRLPLFQDDLSST